MTTSPSPPAALGPLGLWTPFEPAERGGSGGAERGAAGRRGRARGPRAVLVSADRAGPTGEARVGTVFAGDWEIKRRLGAGGMGEVFEALYRRDRQRYALKILAGEHAGRPGMVERFRHEYLALTKMSHPGIVRAHFSGAWEGEEWYSMELLRGASLEEVCRRGPLGAGEVLEIGIELCEALEALHAQGVIHRDLKPANVIVLAERAGGRRVKLLDLGVAKLMPAFYADGEAATPPEARIQTQAGAPLGTPGYMAPEVFRGAAAAVGQDVFGLGVTLFRAATGRLPYADGRAGLEEEPRWSHEVGRSMVVGLELVLRGALAADPAVRFRSMAEFRDELERVREELEAENGVVGSVGVSGGAAGAGAVGAARASATERPVAGRPARWPGGRVGFVAGLAVGVLVTLGVQALVERWERRPGEAVGEREPVEGDAQVEAKSGAKVDDASGDAATRGSGSEAVVERAAAAGEVLSEAPSRISEQVAGEVAEARGERAESGSAKGGARGRGARERAIAAWITENRARLVGCLPWGTDPAAVEAVITIGSGGEVAAVELGGGSWPGMSEDCVGRLLRGLKTPAGSEATTHRTRLGEAR